MESNANFKYQFPVLMETIHSGRVVMFTGETTGVSIRHRGESDRYVSDRWIPFDDSSYWKRFDASKP